MGQGKSSNFRLTDLQLALDGRKKTLKYKQADYNDEEQTVWTCTAGLVLIHLNIFIDLYELYLHEFTVWGAGLTPSLCSTSDSSGGVVSHSQGGVLQYWFTITLSQERVVRLAD